MSYTIPSTVQTKAEAVLAVASAIADEDMGARYDGTVNTSLDVLADVLAAQDVDVPQTNAGAILALAQYAHGGGGGGVQLGPLYSLLIAANKPVAVGGLTGLIDTALISLVKVDGSIIATSSSEINRVALGTVVGITSEPGESFRLFDVTIVNGGADVHGEPVYETAVEVTSAIETMNETIGEGDDAEVYEGVWVTLPAEIADGHDLVLEVTKSN